MSTPGHWPLLMGAGFLAGIMNAVAGGGSFLSFSALVFVGLPSVAANASSTVALFPGALTSAWAYRDGVAGFGPISLRALLAISLIGGLVGAVLLLATPNATFDAVVPWLLLLATLALAFGNNAGAMLRKFVTVGKVPLLVVQFLLSVYGGYFGGAVGIMMMAVWSLLGSADLKAMNPTKVVLVGATNSVAVACFVISGAVRWPETLTMLVAAALGGYAGAHVGRRMDPRHVRIVVTVVTVAMTVVFFVRAP